VEQLNLLKKIKKMEEEFLTRLINEDNDIDDTWVDTDDDTDDTDDDTDDTDDDTDDEESADDEAPIEEEEE
jgi:hypothetical protein